MLQTPDFLLVVIVYNFVGISDDFVANEFTTKNCCWTTSLIICDFMLKLLVNFVANKSAA
jgi:hypothetical protein